MTRVLGIDGKNYLLGLTLFVTALALSLAVAGEFTGASALAATASALAVLFTFAGQKAKETSRSYLEEAKSGISVAYDVARQSQYDRVAWVLAARMISRAQVLSRHITETEHARAFELWVDVYRNRFLELLLADQDAAMGSRFFGNAENWEEALNRQREAGGLLICLPEPVLRAVYTFARYPDDYDDPVGFGDRFSDSEIQELRRRMPALAAYVERRRDPAFRRQVMGAQFRNPPDE